MGSGLGQFVKADEPAAKVPGLTDMLDPTALAAQVYQRAEAQAPTNEQVTAANQKADDARVALQRRATDFSDYMTQQKSAYDAQAQQYSDLAKQQLPQQQPVQPAPGRGIAPFLSGTKEEDPLTTVSKFIQAMSLFATMAGGGRAGARASLSALTGALEGWREGSRYKGETQYQKWKDETEAMFRSFDDEMRRYNSLMIAERVPLDQKMRGLELEAWTHKNQMAAEQFNVDRADKAVAHLEKMRDARDKALQWYASIVARKDEADRQQQLKLDRLQLEGDKLNLLREFKQKTLDLQQQKFHEAISGVTQETMTALGQQWFLSGKMPSIGQDRSGAGIAFRARVLDAGIAWAKSMNIDPMSAPHVRAELQAAQQGVNTLSRQAAAQEASIRRFDGHVDALLKLSAAVPRSEMPAVNGAILRGETKFEGSPKAAAYVAQAFEVGMELARVVLPGSAQGDATTREEARNMISSAYNHEQLKAVLSQLRQNGQRNIENNRASIKSYGDIFGKYGTPGATKPEESKPQETAAPTSQGASNPYNLKQEGNEWVSPDGKYVWRGGAWQKK